MATPGIFQALIAAIPPDEAECQDDESKKRHYQWRRAVFIFLCTFSLTLGYGLYTYATDKGVDGKVEAAVKPITQQVKETAAKLDSLNAQVNSTNKLLVIKLASDLEASIVQTKSLMCKAKSGQGVSYFRDRLNDFIRQYQELTGRETRAPTCADL